MFRTVGRRYLSGMLKRSFIMPPLVLWLGVSAQGQQPTSTPCLTDELTATWLLEQGLPADHREDPQTDDTRAQGDAPTIPVVVHVVWNTQAENIPDALIQSVIQQLDQDFNAENPDLASVRPAFVNMIGNPGIRFCLAQVDPWGAPTNGITRTFTTATWFDPNWQPHAMKSPPLGISAWDPTKYLNIWVCDINGSSWNIVSGYTYLPTGGMAGSPNDGLVIDYQHGMTLTTRTATHEAGHYFGLRHTFDGNSCFSDDGIADTPNTDSPTWSCGNSNLQKCGTLTQFENFLDYAPCLSMFTTQQCTYMNGVLNGLRASLLTATGCGLSTAMPAHGTPAIRIFPNPTQDLLIVEGLGPGTVLLNYYDALGRSVMEEPATGPVHRSDLTNLPAGGYLLSILEQDRRMVVPLIVSDR